MCGSRPRPAMSRAWCGCSCTRRAALKAIDADVAHFTNGMVPLLSRVPTVVTIHDVSLRLYPRYHPPRRVLLNRPLVGLAARRADAIITVSESAKRGHRPALPPGSDARPRRLRSRGAVVHAGARSGRRSRGSAASYGLGRARDPVRRHDRAAQEPPDADRCVRAAAQAGDLSHQLVCVGPYGWLSRGHRRARSRAADVDRAITFTGYVPFEDLPALYSLAEMFVYPVDVRGLRVAGDRSDGVRRAGDHGVGAGAGRGGRQSGRARRASRRRQSLGDALVDLAARRRSGARMAAAGLARAEEFSWDRAARETLEVYRSVAKPPSHGAGWCPPLGAALRRASASTVRLAGPRHVDAA